MSAQPPSNPNPLDEIKTRLQESPDELRAGLADKQPLLQDAKPRYAFGWFDKWMLAIPIGIGVIILLILWSSCRGTPAPTTATLNTPAPNATLQVNEPLTITGTAPPNSQVQILNHGNVVAETVADADGNFVVRFSPQQPGDYELQAVATVDGNPLESVPIQFVIAAAAGQAGLSGQPTAENQTAVAAAQSTATAPPASDNGTAAPGTEGSAQSATPIAGTEGGAPQATPVPGTEGNTQGATTPGTEGGTQGATTPGTEGSTQGASTPGAEGGAQSAATPGTEGSAQGATPVAGTEGSTQGATPVAGTEGSTQGAASVPTTAVLQPPAANTTLQAGESITLTGSAPPNSTVQIYQDGQVIAQTTADANGNFVVSIVPDQAGTVELTAVATTPDGTTLESPPVEFVIVAGTPAPTAEGGAPADTTVSIQAPAADASLQAGVSVTITGSAPPNSTVQITNQGQVVAETKADANGNFVVSVVPNQAGTVELTAVATTPDGTTLESAPVQLVIAAGAEQTPIASAGQNATSVAAVVNETPVPSSEGSTQGGTQSPTQVANAQSGESTATPEAGAQGSTQSPTQVANAQGGTEGSASETQTPVAAESQGSSTPQNSQSALATTPPTVKILAGQWLVPGNSIAGTGTPGSVVKIYLNDTEAGSATVDADGNWQFVLPIETGAGDYALRVVADNSNAGGAGATSESGSELSSRPVAVSVVGITLPVTGKPWYNCWPSKWRR